MTTQSALYVGSVVHRRLRPKAHRLRYRVFYLLLDLDALSELARRLRLFSIGRFNLFGFYPQDHLFSRDGDLRGEVKTLLRNAGLETDNGPVRLLTTPRILGYGFNPLSIFFCYRENGALQAILYEVHNTFHERHCYLFTLDEAKPALRHVCAKEFYVSPFMPLDLNYAFRLKPPDRDCRIAISVADETGPLLVATQKLERRPLDDRALLRIFLLYPLQSLKVIVAIHYEALLIWLKGVAVHLHPLQPDKHVTVVATRKSEKGSFT